jgi:mannose-6-phosphate isomerase-like protein (cupin superfamily)
MRFVLLSMLLAGVALAQRTTPIENDQVRVLSVVDKPSQKKGAMHEHAMNRVMIYLDEGKQRLTYQDGRVVDRAVTPGMVVWDPKGGLHQSENPGSTSVRIVEIELKGEPKPYTPPALDPLKVYPQGYKVELDNSQVRIVRVKVGAGTKLPLHEHALNRVTVFLRPQKMRITPEGATATELSPVPGEVRWGTPVRHVEENLGSGEFEALMVEIK